jgi:hypothetical protein
MNNIQTPFGFSESKFGNLVIYSGKLRFKNIRYLNPCNVEKVEYDNKGYCLISYETTSENLHKALLKKLGRFAKRVAQIRLEQKYNWVK